MNRLLLLLLFFAITNVNGQTIEEVQKELNDLKSQVNTLSIQNATLKKQVLNYQGIIDFKLDTISAQLDANAKNIHTTANALGIKIEETDKSSNVKISSLSNSISQTSLYFILAFIGVALIIGAVYWFLGRKINLGKQDVEDQIKRTKKTVEEETIKLDTKLTELLDSQLKVLQVETTAKPSNDEIDHSLALKVADEIMRINKNLSAMDSDIKGIKQLSAAVKRIQDNFLANGYEVLELLNKPYDKRMKLIVSNTISDETLKPGQEIITKVIKPQVNYKGVMVQSAQVEISVGQ